MELVDACALLAGEGQLMTSARNLYYDKTVGLRYRGSDWSRDKGLNSVSGTAVLKRVYRQNI